MSRFDSTHAPVATAARAAGTGLVSMSTRPDTPGMLHLEREARDWSTYNEYSYRIIRAKRVSVDKSPKVYTQLAREGVVLTQDSDNI